MRKLAVVVIPISIHAPHTRSDLGYIIKVFLFD